MSLSICNLLENSCQSYSIRPLDESSSTCLPEGMDPPEGLLPSALGQLNSSAQIVPAFKNIDIIPSKILGRWYLTGEVPFILRGMIKASFSTSLRSTNVNPRAPYILLKFHVAIRSLSNDYIVLEVDYSEHCTGPLPQF